MSEETRLVGEPWHLKLHGVMSLPDLNQVYIATAGPLPGHDYHPTEEASEVRMFSTPRSPRWRSDIRPRR